VIAAALFSSDLKSTDPHTRECLLQRNFEDCRRKENDRDRLRPRRNRDSGEKQGVAG